MFPLQKMAVSALVWLTAVMTLIAGSPHFDCVCPDGHFKLFCLASAFEKAGCCCGGRCCSSGQSCSCCSESASAASPKPKQRSCCSRESRGHKPAAAPATTVQIQQPHCCVKIATLPKSFTSSPAKMVVQPDTTPSLSLPVAALAASPVPVTKRGRASWQVHLLAPPTDLVIALQHLLI